MKTILVPVDFSETTPKIVENARRLADVFNSRIILLHVVEPEPAFVGFETGPDTVRAAMAKQYHEEHEKLEKLKASLAGLDVLALQIQGVIAERILHECEQQHADVIVVGSHGHGALHHLLAGSVTSAL